MSIDIEQLTHDHKKAVHTVDGLEIHTVPALIAQLREAVYGGMERGGSSAALKSRLPIDAAAFDLYQRIDHEIAAVWAQAFHRPPGAGKTEQVLSEWAAWAGDDTIVDVDGRTMYAPAAVTAWVTRIEVFFDPPRNAEIDAACIACGVQHIDKTVDGEIVQALVLRFVRDRETGETLRAECQACEATWSKDQFDYLGRQIGIDVDLKREQHAQAEAERAAKTRLESVEVDADL